MILADRKANCLVPMRRGGKGWVRVTGAARYETAIQQLCRTPIGTLPWAMDYGTQLHRYRGQGMSEEQCDIILVDLRRAFARWIPDITLVSVRVIAHLTQQRQQILLSWGILASGTRERRFVLGPVNTTVLV